MLNKKTILLLSALCLLVLSVRVDKQATEETAESEIVTEALSEESIDIEIPENAVYKQTVTEYSLLGVETRAINIFDESENMLVSVLYSSEKSESPDERTVYNYDNNRLIGKDFYAGNGVLLYRTIYEYDDNGVIISDTSYYGSKTIKTEYAYDGNGRLISKEYPSGSCEYYKYDNNGNIIETTCGDITDEYTYDEENRLIRHRHNVEYDWRAGYTYSYEYEYEKL